MGLLQDLSWEEAQKELKEADVAIIPVGSTEQHGRHMPLGADTYAPFEIAKRTTEKEKVIVAPAIPYGISQCHMSFPGTITLRCETLSHVLADIFESLYKHGIKKFIILNGHGHNGPSIQTAMDEFKAKAGDALFLLFAWWVAGFKLTPKLWSTAKGDLPDGHAAEVETSVMLSIKPNLVNMSQADKVILGALGKTDIRFSKSTSMNFKDYPIEITTISDFKQFSQSGVVGSAIGATKEKGDQVIERVTDFLAELIRDLKKA